MALFAMAYHEMYNQKGLLTCRCLSMSYVALLEGLLKVS